MSRNKLPKIIVILGPTASGKTELSIKLAKKLAPYPPTLRRSGAGFNGAEIISADSRTIYKEINIGTAKPKVIKNAVNGIYHYMIDICDLNSEFTVAQFRRQAIQIIFDILKRNRVPFIVGGTMLYISALVDNFAIPKVPPDKKLRRKLENMIKQKGITYAYNQLITYDPLAQGFVQAQNPRRIIRALEVCIKTKKPFSSQRIKGKPLFNTLQIGIDIEIEKLYKRIDARVDKMIQNGLMQEVIKLYRTYPNNRILKNTICYQEFFPYLDVLSSLENKKPYDPLLTSLIETIKKNTRDYARRQISWWKKDKRIIWVTSYTQAKKRIKEFLTI